MAQFADWRPITGMGLSTKHQYTSECGRGKFVRISRRTVILEPPPCGHAVGRCEPPPAVRYRQCVGVACAEGRGPVGLSRGPTNAGPSIRRCLIQVTEVRPWSGIAMRGLSAAERHLRATSAHPPSRCARRSTPASSQASLGTRRRPSGEGAAPLWLLLLACTTCSAHRSKHLSML